MQQITYITVDVGRIDSIPPIIPAKQGDTGRYVQATVTDKGVPFTPSGAIAVARIRKPDGTACVYDEGISISGGVVIFPLVAQALTAAGRARGEISLYTSAADRITTFDFWLDIEKNAVADAEIASSDYYNILTAQIAQILSSNTIVKPLGYYATLAALNAGVPSPNPGDMYAVGAASPYDYYVWDGVGQQWVNNGPLEGAPGATFTPIVYSDGVLAWTNDAGLDNPEPVNITGPIGPPGTGLNILGYYATLEALMTDVTAPAAGDTYGVGLAAPYDIYVWDGVGQRWVDNGQLEGVPGAPGATFTPSVAADGTLSWTNDGGLENPAPVNIKGPTGPAGPNRITADTDTSLNGVIVGDGEGVSAVNVLPILMGGTGASNAAAALTALGLPCEVGTWTPTLKGATTQGEYTPGKVTGSYVRVGKIVFVQFDIAINSVTSPGTGYPVIGELPYAASVRGIAGISFTSKSFNGCSTMDVIGTKLYLRKFIYSGNEIIQAYMPEETLNPASESRLIGAYLYTIA